MRRDSQVAAEQAYDERQKEHGYIKLGIRIRKEHKPAFTELARKSREGTAPQREDE
ncbi:MAG: hypothetical protein V3T88_07555 [Nitrosomonadaceae bacterium]